MKVALYARVSTEDQNVDQQVDYLKKWALRENFEVVKVVSDKESGTLNLVDRKKFISLLKDPGAQAILVFRLDRLTRNWDDVTLIERYFRIHWDECRLISAGEPVDLSCATGRAQFRMMMVFNCYMPEDMREKQRVGIDRAKAEGKYRGGVKGRSWSHKPKRGRPTKASQKYRLQKVRDQV